MEPYIKVQRGETVFSSGDGTTKDVTLGTALADTTKAFIYISVRGEGTTDAQDLDEIFCTAEIVNTTTIRFKRFDNTEGCVVAWQVVEANGLAPTQAFEVQTGEVTFTTSDTAKTDTITDISDTSNAIIIVQTRAGDASDDPSDFAVRGTFDSSTTVRLQRTGTGDSMISRYWVVKWSSDFVVRKGSVAMTGSATANDTFSAITTGRSLIFIEYDVSANGIAQRAVKAHLSSSTQIDFERSTSTGNCNIEYAVVEFPSVCVGQANATDWGGTGYSDTTTVTSVDLDATILTASNECTGTGTALPRGVITTLLSDATTVTMQCSYDGQTKTVSWTLIDTSAWEFTPYDPWQAQANGEVTDDGGASITRRGFVYDDATITDPGNVDPDTLGIGVVDESGTYGEATYNLLITGLEPAVTHYVRAFAENSAGFSYGAQESFVTEAGYEPLVAVQGSYTATGQAVTLRINRRIACTQGSYTLTGYQAGFTTGKQIVASQATYTLTGQGVDFARTYRIVCDSGGYTTTGYQAGLTTALQLVASQASYTLNGQSVGLTVNRLIEPVQGDYALTGQDTAFTYTEDTCTSFLLQENGDFLLQENGDKILLEQCVEGPVILTADQGSYTLSGQDVGLTVNRVIQPTQGSYTLTGYQVGLSENELLVAEQGTYSLSGQDVTFRLSRTLTIGQGAYTLSGQDTPLLRNRRLEAEQGSYTLTGQDVELDRGQQIAAEQGSYALTGQSVGLRVNRVIQPVQGSYTLTGQNVRFGGAKTIAINQGSYTLTGNAVGLRVNRTVAIDQGEYTLTGYQVGIAINPQVVASQGSYVLTGQDVTLTYSPIVITGNIKYWTGTEWRIVPLMRYDGTMWQDTSLKRWDGSSWQEVNY